MSSTKRADVQTVRASSPDKGTERDLELQYADSKVIGNGSFGVVYRAVLVHNNEEVAIKKVLQDKRYKNRELQIMRRLEHRNVVKLKYFFYSAGEKKDELYLNLILEYVPDTVYRVARHYSKQRQIIPITYIRVYMYQLFRALGYIHSIGICHRDIKPQNLLLNVQTSVLKLCDFGSAKSLVPGEPNVAYICSRYYRAPELIFGATDYTTRIDVWSAGTVLAELLMGQPFFPGDSGVDQLVEIIKVLGTPSRDEIQQMNPNYKEFRFPTIRPHPWTRVFRARTPQDSIDLVSHLLKYNPEARLTPHQAMAHEFFNELRVAGIKLPSNAPMPPLFDFSNEELTNCDADLRERLLPRQPAPNAPQLPSTAATPNAAEEAAAGGSQAASRKSSGAESIKHSNGSKQGSKSPARNAAAAPPPADSTSVTAINTAIQSQQQQQQTALRKKSSVSSATGTPGGGGSILPEFGGNGNNNSSSAAVQSHQQPPPSQPQQQQPQASSATLHG